MRILNKQTTIDELKSIAETGLGEMVKAVVDIDLEIVAIDAELHSDLEAHCLERYSRQESLWEINYYPEMEGEDFIEYDPLINIRPSQGNRSRDVEEESIRNKIVKITKKWIKK